MHALGSHHDSYMPTLDEQRGYWDQRWNKTRVPSDYSVRRGERILEMLRPLRLQGVNILDLGCATGWFTDQLSRFGPTTGLDLSPAAISLAKSYYPGLNFIAGNVFEMPLPAAQYDVVVSQEVIAHVEDPGRLLDRICTVLKPRGYLVITTANKLVIERTVWPDDPREHIKKWLGMRDLKRMLAPRFDVLDTSSTVSMGTLGFLRIVNSYRLNRLLQLLVPAQALERAKERAGWGYSLIVVARKR